MDTSMGNQLIQNVEQAYLEHKSFYNWSKTGEELLEVKEKAKKDEFLEAISQHNKLAAGLFEHEKYDVNNIKKLRKALGGDWNNCFLQVRAMEREAGLSIAALIDRCNGLNKLITMIENNRYIAPDELIAMFRIQDWNMADFEKELQVGLKIAKNKPKVIEHSMQLFTHPDLRKMLMAQVSATWEDISIENALPLEIKVVLKANNPQELLVGLDNPRMLQAIKNAGDFQLFCRDFATDYKNLCEPHKDLSKKDFEPKAKKVASDVVAALEKRSKEAADRAEKEAKAQFGMKADVKSEGRWRIFKCVFAVGSAIVSIIATIGAFMTAIPAGFIALHSCIKGMQTCITTLEIALNGFEANMKSAEAEFATLYEWYKKNEQKMQQTDARLAETFFGEIVNPTKNAAKYLATAKADLSRMESPINDLSQHINTFLRICGNLAKDVNGLEKSVAAGKKEIIAMSPPPQDLEKRLAVLMALIQQMKVYQDDLSKWELKINELLERVFTQSQFIRQAKGRIKQAEGIESKVKKKEPKLFFLFMDTVDFSVGLIGGSFAAGGGSFANGINPVQPKDWVTAFNIVGLVGATSDAVDTAKTTVELGREKIKEALQ